MLIIIDQFHYCLYLIEYWKKLMCKRLMEYSEKLNIIFENQFGSRSGYYTVQAVTLITDKIQKAIENKRYSCGIFLDLQPNRMFFSYPTLQYCLAILQC